MIENVAAAIFSEPTSVSLPQVTTTIYGTAVSDSSDGIVTVVMDGESVTQPSGEEETVTLTPDEFTDGRANLPSAAYSGTVVIVDSNGRQLDEDEFQVDGSVLTIEALQGGVPVVVDYLASITSTVSSDQFPDGKLELPYTPVGDISVTVDGEAVEYTADGAVLTIPSAAIATDAVFEITYVREVSVSPVFDERQYILADSPESITLVGLTLSESEEAVETAIADYTLDGALLTIGESVSYEAYRLTYQMTEVTSLNWTDTVEEEDDSEDVEEDEETEESTEEETESQAGIVELSYHPISLSITKDGEEYADYTLDDRVVTLAWTPDTPVSYTIAYQALYSVSYVSSEFTVGSVTLPYLPAGTIDDDVLTPTQMSVTVDDSPVEYTLQGVDLSIPSLVLAVTSYSVSYQAENTTGEVEIPTSPAVREGESVQISVINGTPVVTSVLGWGDAEDARISSIEVDYVKASTLEADVAVLGYAKVTELEATNARVGTLEATTADIDTIRANSAKVNDITANQLTAATGYIETLTTNSVTAQNLVSDHGEFADVKANSAKVANLTAAQLEADHATVTNLNANYAQINLANVNNAWIQNGVVKDGSITNAMINDVSANKLTAGTIDASNITVTNLNASNITTGTINGQRLGEGSISLSKLEDDVYTESEINTIVDGLNDRIDGAIETFTGTDVPTLNNTPASSWSTDELKDSHVGDVYYVVNSSSQQNGYCYRFTKSGSSYSWQLIKDSDVTAALSRLTTAEGHITQFDTDISTLKTDTGSLKTRTTTLETQMSDAQTQISTKVDTSTFNNLSSTVDSNSATITSLSTVVTNNGLTSETNITNTVNSVSQTATSNASKITGLETITTNNGLTSSTNITSAVSSIEQDLNSLETTVSTTTATVDGLTTRVGNAETRITENANNISLKAERSDIYTTVIDEDDQEVEVKAWDAAIDVTADAIRSEVKDVSDAVDKKADSSDHNALVTRVSDIEQRAGSIEASVAQRVTQDDVETYVKAQLGLTTQDFTVTFEEDIANAKTEVLNTVENTYVTSEAADDAYASKSGTQESIAAALSAIAEVTAAVNDETAARKQWLDFNRDAGLLIGSVDSNVFLELSNDRISFMDTEGVESAYASNGEFHAPTLVADDRLELGNWAIIPRDNGNLTFKWIGEDE